jgi:cobaltochelatase CobN
MHRIAATPGGWTPQTEGVMFVEQSTAPVVILTAADTDIQTLASALPHLPPDFPALRVVNLLNLQQQLSIDTYAETVLEPAQVIVLRLLGGQAYWSYGLEVLQDTAARSGAQLVVLPGDDQPDPALMSHSTVPLEVANQLWRYLQAGGVDNWSQGLRFLGNATLGRQDPVLLPQTIPTAGRYVGAGPGKIGGAIAGILFYRAHYLAGNTAVIDALCEALADQGLDARPVFVSSLRDPEAQKIIQQEFQAAALVLNTTSFAIAQPLGIQTGARELGSPKLDAAENSPQFWQQLNLPVFQVILSGSTQAQWTADPRGLTPRDMAMNVALPEIDGRIITRAVSFKAVQQRCEAIETEVVTYEPEPSRIKWVAQLAANWVKLRQTAVGDRKVALVLANYPTKDGRLANGVGLDTPASCVAILAALAAAGYRVERLPQDSQELISWLTEGRTNDPEGQAIRPALQGLDLEQYQDWLSQQSGAVQSGMGDRWGAADRQLNYGVAGVQLGNIFVGIQPSRGYDRDPSLNYHAPDLEPTHDYAAFYHWLRSEFGADAVVHVGKHGNLEWLPGKGIALSQDCYPEAMLGPVPNFYPFIVNDPGEGAQAKRRSHAVILDHLTPPMTRAELYGPLQQLERLIDEYYEAISLDPVRVGMIRDRIVDLIQTHQIIRAELSVEEQNLEPDWLKDLDGYLCELKEAQIRDGLHIFGQQPQGQQLRDLVIAIARQPGAGRIGLTRAISASWGLDFDPLTEEMQRPLTPAEIQQMALHQGAGVNALRIAGDLIEAIETEAIALIEPLTRCEVLTENGAGNGPGEASQPGEAGGGDSRELQTELDWIAQTLLPNLAQTPQEINNLLRGLNGEYVAAGPSGAPTRGRPEVLPTGRNFYSVDLRALPTETAWDVGRKAAEVLVERYTQEQGEYPQTLGLSVWGTATMRTGGDDIAEALALMGVRPVWDGTARRVVDFEILPLSVLGRPRVDVTLRISGFFRDAFANLIDLFDQAVRAVAQLEESAEMNPLAARVQQETIQGQAEGLTAQEAMARSQLRVFGSKPGAYGAGLQGLIESQNWESDADLAQAYLNWSSYAYTGSGQGQAAPEAFAQRLGQLQIVLQNQDNREHDLLDSDDYYQFQGGLTAAVRSLRGENPVVYFGDHAQPENPKVRSLASEIERVYRSRVVNPKWIAGTMRHGYKGAFELAATLDYLFAYDVTTQCVPDDMYTGIAQAYVLDPQVQAFALAHNPWALRDMAERLLEAQQRQLWKAPSELIDSIQGVLLSADSKIEHSFLRQPGS